MGLQIGNGNPSIPSQISMIFPRQIVTWSLARKTACSSSGTTWCGTARRRNGSSDRKWESIHPKPDQYDFSAADRYVEFGKKNGMFIVGHNMVWHSQTPKWVFRSEMGIHPSQARSV